MIAWFIYKFNIETTEPNDVVSVLENSESYVDNRPELVVELERCKYSLLRYQSELPSLSRYTREKRVVKMAE